MKKFLKPFLRYLVIVALLIKTSAGFAAIPAEELTNILNHWQTVTADFTQLMLDEKNKTYSVQTMGKMYLQRPSKFRWETTSPDQQIMIANHKTLWTYDLALAQVTKKHIEEQDGSPMLLLSNPAFDFLHNFKVKKINLSTTSKLNSIQSFELTPKNSQHVMFEGIQLDFKNNQLISMLVKDNLGQQSKFVFSAIKLNLPLNPKLFEFIIPKNVDVVN